VRNIKLIIEYDGTNYHGWQRQKNALTVQGVIEDAIFSLTKEKVSLIGASRTDEGVHALGQVANFYTNSKIPPEMFSYALNSVLPDDIVIKESSEVDYNFHSRYLAKGKKYRYIIYNHKHPSALLKNYSMHVPYELNFEEMAKASQFFKGKYDFTSFKASGSSAKTSIRTIWETSLVKKDNLIIFEICGDGFLYNMVRIIAGTLIDVGLGKITSEDIISIIEAKDRNKAGKTAPPQGLYLVEIYY